MRSMSSRSRCDDPLSVYQDSLTFDPAVQLVEQNTTLKKEVGITERRLLSRNDRIQHLEALLTQADAKLAQKNQKYEAQLQTIRERLAEG